MLPGSPGMRSIHPHKWQNDGLETGIMGPTAARLAWATHSCPQLCRHATHTSVAWGLAAAMPCRGAARTKAARPCPSYYLLPIPSLLLRILKIFKIDSRCSNSEKFITRTLKLSKSNTEHYWTCSYGCHNFSAGSANVAPTRDSCATNPSTDIAGLMAVLPRLLALPTTAASAAQRVRLSALPRTHARVLEALLPR